MALHRRGVAVPAYVELSRTRTLKNSIRIEGTNGSIEWKFGERSRLLVNNGHAFVDTMTGAARPCAIEARWADEHEQPGYEGFRAQIDDWLQAIAVKGEAQVSGESVLPSVDLIEQCYARRTPMAEPWFTENLPAAVNPAPRPVAQQRRVLVTGASGFIGCRLSERLHFGSDWRVRALIRNPGRAVRLARMPVEFALGDLASPADLARSLEGCDAVVHAGIGTSWRESERIATTVKGTKNLVDAALRAGVKRFVHISTIALYGDQVTGTITEETPARPAKGWDYAESKLAAEQIVLEAASRGLPAVVLRVAVVYGPHNLTMVARPLQHLAAGKLMLVECRDVPSNTIYVDNLCEGIRVSLDAPASVNGQIFLMTDDDGYSWGEYYGYFADRIGATVHHVPKSTASAPAPPPALLKRWATGTRDLVLSPEVKGLAKRIYQSDPWGTPARWAIDTFPQAVEKLKGWVRPEEAFVYRPNPVVTDELSPFTVDPIAARVSADKARRVLGYEPLVARGRAMALTLEWARHARLVPERSREEVGTAR
jgi:nucleoside-diphosphate-sugar epimerase